jgi:hypothetical protein
VVVIDRLLEQTIALEEPTRWVVWCACEHAHFVTTFDQSARQVIYPEILGPKVLGDNENFHGIDYQIEGSVFFNKPPGGFIL